MEDNILKEKFSLILDRFYPTRTKCKCCGGEIYYVDSCAEEKIGGGVKIHGKSFLTKKLVDGTEYHLLVCEKCLLERFPDIKNLSRIFNVMCEPTKFAFDIPEDVYLGVRSGYAMTKEKMISKYGKEEGLERWNDYCKKQSVSNTFEYKKKKYGWTEEQFKEYNKSRAVTKKNLISKYGDEEGLERYESYVNKQHMTKSWEYMVEKYGEEKAREINRSKVISLDKYIELYGVEDGRIRWEKFINNRLHGWSKQSQQVFRRLDKYLCPKYTTRYATKGGEYCVDYNGIDIHMDYFIEELNICIEFNGSIFHGDPRIFEDDCRCNPFDRSKTAKELRDKDSRRYKLLQNEFGIKTFVIWELDVNNGDFDEYEFITKKLNIKL